MIGYLVASFYIFHVLVKKQKLKINQDKQSDRPSNVGWPVPRETTIKIKVSFTGKKVLYFKESLTFQSKCCIFKESIVLNRKFYLSKRNYYN